MYNEIFYILTEIYSDLVVEAVDVGDFSMALMYRHTQKHYLQEYGT